MTRPKSTIPKSSTSRTGATMANSTIDCERWPTRLSRSHISVTTDRHVRVGHDADRVAERTLQHARDESEAHDQDHVHVGALVAVVERSACEVQPRCVRVADVE